MSGEVVIHWLLGASTPKEVMVLSTRQILEGEYK